MIKPKTLPKKVQDIFNERLVDEHKAFYTYKAVSNWCDNVGFKIAAEYFRKESADELVHASLLQKFMVDWNCTPQLPVIETPNLGFANIGEVIDLAYSLEFALYEAYEDNSATLFDLDLCAFDYFQQFRTIQKDSVAEYATMINVLEGVELTKMNLLLLEETLFEN